LTSNYFINCNVCRTTINLRAQIGFYDIPFNIYCPHCQTHINGKLVINQDELGIDLQIENAIIDSEVEIACEKMYCAELSAEFPTTKMHLRDFERNDLPPFIRNMKFYDDDKEAVKATEDAMLFSKHFSCRWKEIKVLYELFWNKKFSLLYPKLENEISNYDYMPLTKVSNEFDACMALHQLFITTTGLTKALDQQELENYTRISKLVTKNLNVIKQVQKYTQNDSLDFDNLEKKAFKLIDIFIEIYEQLIPVVALRNSNCLGNVNKEKYGIMTTNFEELTSFYASSYEWILENIDVVIALNNIVSRNSYNECVNSKTFDSLAHIGSKFKKLEYLDNMEPFSPPTDSLKNRIRNSIQHIDCDIDYETQEITFLDSYRGKTKEVKMYLIDFVDLCLENFSIIIYILELVYNLRKANYRAIGLIPSFLIIDDNDKTRREGSKKIGRNSPCPCGSGKKYKKCCI